MSPGGNNTSLVCQTTTVLLATVCDGLHECIFMSPTCGTLMGVLGIFVVVCAHVCASLGFVPCRAVAAALIGVVSGRKVSHSCDEIPAGTAEG